MKIKFILALLLFVIPSCGSQKTDHSKDVSPHKNQTSLKKQKAPPFALKDLNGKTVRLTDYKGKVVLLDFWATWCPPCRMSTPALVRLNEKMQNKNVVVLGISLDEQTNIVPAYVQKAKIKHSVLYGSGSSIGEDYRINSIPTFYLIDQEGFIHKSFSGFYSSMEQEWKKEILSLLSSK